MIFFLCFAFSVLYSYQLGLLYSARSYTVAAKYIGFFPVVILWIIICGGQYYVGTDYPSYIRFFNGIDLDHYLDTGEIGFVYVVKLLIACGFRGNGIYAIFYSLCFVLLGVTVFISKINSKYIFIFTLLYIGFTGLFNNQLNYLRQGVTIYMGTLGGLEIIRKKYMAGLILILCSISFHTSAVVLLLFFATPLVNRLSLKYLYGIILLGAICGIALSIDSLNIIYPYLPPAYAWHIDGGAINERNGMLMITKYMFIPLYLLSVKKYTCYNLSQLQSTLFKWGIVGFALKVGLLGLSIVNRIAEYWLIFSVFPLFFYLMWLWKEGGKKRKLALFWIIFISSFYFMKTCILPSNEYLYNSIYQFYF